MEKRNGRNKVQTNAENTSLGWERYPWEGAPGQGACLEATLGLPPLVPSGRMDMQVLQAGCEERQVLSEIYPTLASCFEKFQGTSLVGQARLGTQHSHFRGPRI